MVVMGAMRMPDTVPISAARKKVARPAKMGEMPISRAPNRLKAAARSALPYIERSKNWYSTMISTADTATTHSAWLLMLMGPSARLASLKGAVRAPSAPKARRPRPTSARWTAMDTISSPSVEADAMGW
ncbi:hypothetical protein G6F60_014654 [Rhizopus arrhizus]|nr:hypothetical protein G6F60_014654 [Rhizopus arrhizus]